MIDSLRRLVILTGITLLAGVVHYFILGEMGITAKSVQLPMSYLGNLFIASGLLLFLLNAPKSLQPSLGFLFLFGSIFKFVFFFVFLLPLFQADGGMNQTEFFAFFIPYGVCLATETKLLISKLSQG